MYLVHDPLGRGRPRLVGLRLREHGPVALPRDALVEVGSGRRRVGLRPVDVQEHRLVLVGFHLVGEEGPGGGTRGREAGRDGTGRDGGGGQIGVWGLGRVRMYGG